MKYIIGIDEAGRGPLAGPISVGAFLLKSNGKQNLFKGIKNSKQLSEKKREEWFERFNEEKKKGNINFSTSMVGSKTIDNIGIVRATKMALRRSLRKLKVNPENCEVFLDGSLYAPQKYLNQKTFIKGDERIRIIAAASIVAKVKRDRKMRVLAKKYPKYDFEIHKGYGTKGHYGRIKRYGCCEIHRKSFLDN